MRRAAAMTVVLAAAVAAGCMPSQKLAPGELDRYVALRQDVSLDGPPYRPAVGDRLLPGKWIIRQKPSVIWSTITLLRAGKQLKANADEVEVCVSPTHAKALADVLDQARVALEDLRETAATDREVNRQRWAEGLARALVRVEAVARAASVEGAERQADRGAEPAAMAAEPLLSLVAVYLNEQAGGGLLADLGPQDMDRLRQVLAQVVLRLGFAIAGQRVPEGLRESVAAAMEKMERPEDLEKALYVLLNEGAAVAPPDAGGGLSETVRSVLAYAPKALKALESFVRQWDKMDRLELEFHEQEDQTVVAATVHVLPGREVRLDDLVMFQPALVFRGASRIIIQPTLPGTGETVVAFEPAGDGAVELRFEGLLYGLARLLVIPIADGALREIRVFAKTRDEGEQVINVAMVMEALGDTKDPRRLVLFQDVREKRLVRGPFSLRSVEGRTQQVFNYLTPDRRYTYKRVKPAAE